MELAFLQDLKLRYVSDTESGYIRNRRGKGFFYTTAVGEKVTDAKVIERIRGLVIPPMWKKVWICKHANGHIQVTGLDAKNRKQYIYHPAWTEHRQSSKFLKMADFAKFLPLIRAHVKTDLRRHGWPKEKALALVINLLDEAHMRIGNLYYRDLNNTYGLTTLRRRHMKINGSSVQFEYKAKSGIQRKVKILDKGLVRLIKQCAELPGYEVFKYLDGEGHSHTLDSHDVNQYLKTITGENFSSKDFRTWGATRQAVCLFPEAVAEHVANPKKKLRNLLVKKVAEKLGNTQKVCETYYIHPYVLEILLAGEFDQYTQAARLKYRKLSQSLRPEEVTALYLIERYDELKAALGSAKAA
ncbi:MAG: DNA topoisomerase IB [Chitinophagales bacterium]|nr:DNA topoisomerase IB [Chitinophagales bacterium]